MKILQVISTLEASYGGPVEGLIQQGQKMKEYGHLVHTLSLDTVGQKVDPRIASEAVYLLGPKFGVYGYSKRLQPWLREHAQEYDIIIVHGMWQYTGFSIRKISRSIGIPYVIFLHGMLDPWFARTYPLKHLKKWLYWPWAEYRILRDASLVLFTTQEEMTLARQSFWLYKAREKLVGYGISGRASGSTSQQNEFFKAFPALRNKRNILFLSRIHPKKGCDLLINAFIKVSSSDPDLNLIIAGPDQVGWQEKLSKIAQNAGVGDRVIFTGILSGALKWGAFDASEVFILPSHQENFGIVLAEALASSLPVLTTYNVNIWREIQHGKAGLIGTDTQEGVDDLLVRWCTMDVKEREEIKRNTLVCFNRNFEISNVTQNLLTALQSVIGK